MRPGRLCPPGSNEKQAPAPAEPVCLQAVSTSMLRLAGCARLSYPDPGNLELPFCRWSGAPLAKRVYRHMRYLILLIFSLLLTVPGIAMFPPLDRDESRYVQATKQMVESGDYIDIRFQEEHPLQEADRHLLAAGGGG